jgi:hypothetical protein
MLSKAAQSTEIFEHLPAERGSGLKLCNDQSRQIKAKKQPAIWKDGGSSRKEHCQFAFSLRSKPQAAYRRSDRFLKPPAGWTFPF